MKKVLITPLDWGLGHATRCIPIIRELISRGCSVSIGGSGDSLTLLRNEFPSLSFFDLPGYNPVYPSSGSMVWKMASQLSKFRKVIRDEHDAVERISHENKIDLIISDNRYGCWSEKIPCVFISHQTNILMPKRFGWLASMVRYLTSRMINRFDYCCIPDYPDHRSLGGQLVEFGNDSIKAKVLYMGSLSRFKPSASREKKFDVLCILSGPEPQRSMLEKVMMDQLPSSGLKYLIVRGLLSSSVVKDEQIVDFLATEKLQEAIEQSEVIIARSGFSTVMDLATLGKRAIFIPTPGQTEQEYLADTLMKKRIIFSMTQDQFDLPTAWEESKKYTGFKFPHYHDDLLKKALNEILS
ncbi:MAG TPA: glycosyltransferase [Chryseolinea sp.]|nr:glycosyltransferase [Chryseolinea sp.]HPM30507.1 glycosyltransferase [Chryseolinea sp.]